MENRLRIKSTKQALKLHRKLKSCWSHESLLSQKILIYIAELLEKQTKPKRRLVLRKRNS